MANLCIKLNLCFFSLLEAKELACKDNLANDDTASKGDPFVTVHLKSRYVLDYRHSSRAPSEYVLNF